MPGQTMAEFRRRQRRRDYRDCERGASVLVAGRILPREVIEAVRQAIRQDYSPRSISQALVSMVATRRENYSDPAAYFAAMVKEQQTRGYGKARASEQRGDSTADQGGA